MSSKQELIDKQPRFWGLIAGGSTLTAACEAVGVHRATGRKWRQATGGRIPRKRPAPSGRYLSLEERLQIADLYLGGAGVRAIAVGIGRTPAPPRYRSAICSRSSKDRYRPDGAGRFRGIRPPVACRHLRPVALLTPTVSLAPVNVEPPAINTQNRACLSIRSFFNDIHNTSDQNGVATTD